MIPRATLAATALLALAAPALAVTEVFPGATWQTLTPTQVGLDVVKLDELATMVGGSGMIVRYGYQVYTWGNPAELTDWASASKCVTSTELFFADHEGLCTIHSDIGSFHTGGSPKDSSITFYHLANMTSGYSRAEWPGEAWAYNDYAVNLYSFVLTYKVFGTPPKATFDSRFGFLQLQDYYRIDNGAQIGRIEEMTVRDFARIGLFWLNKGNWNGTQILPASYFDTWVTNQVSPTLPISSADGPESWALGSNGGGDNQDRDLRGHYGMSFYVNTNGWWPGLPADIIQANGHDGRRVITMIPDLRIVAVGNGVWGNPTTAALSLIYDAQLTVSVEDDSWGGVKAGYRE